MNQADDNARLIEELCQRLKVAWSSGQPQRIEDLLPQAPAPLRERTLSALIAAEAELRRGAGQEPRAHEYLDRFPEDPRAVQEAFGKPDPHVTRAPQSSDTAPLSSGGNLRGCRIGPYRLLQELGQGGMGVVFLAEQVQPVKRRVAIKIIRAGMDSAQIIARFEQERQALAMMDHPNIAKVLDAGTIDASRASAAGSPNGLGSAEAALAVGRPYFVMELVRGIPITTFCDQEHLTPRQRLELFVPVCHAVQHAHQKGVIHRDLKPSNVLVALYDGRPAPKVIDFGVAKATAQKLTDKTMYTEVGQIVGTLEYMAPEQAELNNLDIDTRADIYSLGVLLYELLTGSTPFTRSELKQAAFTEMLRLIRDVEPPKPSTKLSSSAELPAIAARRKLEPRRLQKMISGELDWIAMKCLEKERQRRYDTANGLAMDIQRYLANEPVLAGPPGAGYRLRKFLRRHKGPVAAGGLIVASLIAGVMGTTWGLIRAEAAQRAALNQAQLAEAARAKTRAALDEVSSEAIETLLLQQPELTERHKAFLRRALELYQEFAEDPASDPVARAEVARAHLRMGNIRLRLGELSEAEMACGRAISLWSALMAEFPQDAGYVSALAKAQDAMGGVFNHQAKKGPAEDSFRNSVELLTQLHQQHPEDASYRADLAKSLVSLANIVADRVERQEAEQGYRAAILLLEPLAASSADGEVRSRLANARYNLALLLDEMGKSEASESEYQRAIDVNESLVRDFPQVHDYARRLSSCMINLSELLAHRQAWDEAEQLHRKGLQIQEQLTRDFPSIPEYQKFLGRTLGSLAALLEDRGKLDDAREMYRRAIEVKQQLTRKYPNTPDYLRDLGSIYNNAAFFELMAGRLAEAEAGFRQALAIQEPLVHEHATIAEFRRELANSYGNLGEVLLRKKAFAEAEQAYRSVLQQSQELVAQFPKEPEYLLRQGADEGNIAETLAAQNRKEASLEWYDRSLEHMRAARGRMLRKSPGADEWLLNTTSSRAMTLEQLGRFSDALADWEQCLPMAQPERHDWVRLRRALCLAQSGRSEEAVAEANAVADQISDKGELQLEAARVFARAAEASADHQEEYAVRCLVLLRSVEKNGYFTAPDKLQELQADPHLAGVRSRSDYQEWSTNLSVKEAVLQPN